MGAADESYYAVQGRPRRDGGPWHFYKNAPAQETALAAIDAYDFLCRTVPAWEFRIVHVSVEVILPLPEPEGVKHAE